ncbi:lck-interacting transmembrane adapter 1 isoform X1 [Panthera tigris]|uniref:lck-interacting transmembrane adapter 1 isoform X1 n=1 Tax=Panthera tigris TaxID=9694 RepID=UPI000766382C|nr:lck-interacting transmembrane adapter 1 isoform X1 [Panthera tigris]
MWGDVGRCAGRKWVGSSAEVCTRAPLKVPKPLGLLQPGLRRSYRAQGLGLAVASQDGATGALGPSCPLGPRVPCLVPLAVDTVHSLPQSLLRQHHLCSLSKSDTRLHELHRGPKSCRAPRPASVDILHPRWLEVPRGTSRPLTAFSHRELPRATPAATLPSICPEATYSNVGLAARPVVWAGARLTSSHARPGPEAGPRVAEYACIQKLEGTDQGPRSLRQWKAEVTPAVQVDILYSRVKKPKKRDLGPATDQLDPKGRGEIPALGSDQAYETLPLRGLGMDDGLPDNVYETIQEMGAPEHQEPSGCSY